MAGAPLLEVEDLRVEFITRRGVVPAVSGVSFEIGAGDSLGLVGESGSGKTVTAHTVMGLLDFPGRVRSGAVRWRGRPLPFDSRFLRDGVRGREIAIVFQDALTALNPLLTIGTQIGEVLVRQMGMTQKAARMRAAELLGLVGIADARRHLRSYPHEFSGGMRQRAMIAMALACEPKLLVADEPTTALDVTIQAQIIYLLRQLQADLGLSLLFITHDLGVIAALCERVAVIYAGRIVESGPTEEVFTRPAHPYTAGLLRSSPRLDDRLDRLIAIEGTPPDLRALPAGCTFAARCPIATNACREAFPRLESLGDARHAACLRPFAATASEAGAA